MRAAVVSCLCAVVVFGGCGGTSGPPYAPVSGVVTLDGKGVEGATVTFAPKTEGSLSIGMTDAQGNFSLKAATGKAGAAVGEHHVTVALFTTQGEPAPKSSADDLSPAQPNEIAGPDDQAAAPAINWIVPERYSKKGALSATVPKGGLKGHKLELTSQ